MIDETLIIRLMKQDGYYPSTTFQSGDVAFVSDLREGFVYSVVPLSPEDENYRKSDLSWAYISEIRLWSAVCLSLPEGEGTLLIYPHDMPIQVSKSEILKIDSRKDDLLSKINAYLRDKMTGLGSVLGNQHYSRHQFNYQHAVQEQLYSGISLKNDTLIRGLSCLIKSKILSKHYIFNEEAAIMIYISLEAALRLIHHRLESSGNQNPSFEDVYNYVHNNVNEYFPDYYQECYEKRILLLHPENRYGSFSIPPLEADDFFDTYDSLISFYRFILLGEKPTYD